jgi:hypothetical protein
MELYTQTSAKISDDLLRAYSTSFGFSSLLFPKRVRSHIANVYGLVRIADEIVDTYRGTDSLEILDNLENETYKSIKRQYSANPVVNSFALSDKEFNIEKSSPSLITIRRNMHASRATVTKHHQGQSLWQSPMRKRPIRVGTGMQECAAIPTQATLQVGEGSVKPLQCLKQSKSLWCVPSR